MNEFADTLQFSLHARHTWLAHNKSILKMPWEFRLMDQLECR